MDCTDCDTLKLIIMLGTLGKLKIFQEFSDVNIATWNYSDTIEIFLQLAQFNAEASVFFFS